MTWLGCSPSLNLTIYDGTEWDDESRWPGPWQTLNPQLLLFGLSWGPGCQESPSDSHWPHISLPGDSHSLEASIHTYLALVRIGGGLTAPELSPELSLPPTGQWFE